MEWIVKRYWWHEGRMGQVKSLVGKLEENRLVLRPIGRGRIMVTCV
jgi:hypothetical protein